VAPIATAPARRPSGAGYDGSEESRAALAAARTLAERTGAKLRVLEVATAPDFLFTGFVPPFASIIETLIEEAQKDVDALPDVEGSALWGIPGEELAQLSGEVDLLIVGSRGYGPIGRLIHGSTSNYLQRHARGPLLVLPRAGTAASAERVGSQ
jgi:nucleotide-binding universal stress UspA family protein